MLASPVALFGLDLGFPDMLTSAEYTKSAQHCTSNIVLLYIFHSSSCMEIQILGLYDLGLQQSYWDLHFMANL